MLSPCSPSSHIHSFPPLHDTVSFASLKKPFIPLKRQKGSNYFSCDSCSFAWRLVHNFLRLHSNLPIPHLPGSKTLLQPLWGLQWGTWPQPIAGGGDGAHIPVALLEDAAHIPLYPWNRASWKRRGEDESSPGLAGVEWEGASGWKGKFMADFWVWLLWTSPLPCGSARDLSPFSEKFREHHNP